MCGIDSEARQLGASSHSAGGGPSLQGTHAALLTTTVQTCLLLAPSPHSPHHDHSDKALQKAAALLLLLLALAPTGSGGSRRVGRWRHLFEPARSRLCASYPYSASDHRRQAAHCEGECSGDGQAVMGPGRQAAMQSSRQVHRCISTCKQRP